MHAHTILKMQLVFVVAINAVDYCSLPNCNYKHVACHHNGTFAARCPKSAYLLDLQPYEEFILRLFNQLRNKVAGGQLKGLPKAARMAEMQWCNELAHLAKLNAYTCRMKPDKCRATLHFANAGQTVAVHSYAGAEKTFQPEELIKERIEQWFAQSKHVTESVIHLYPHTAPAPYYGDFTLAITDRNTHVGCAVLRYHMHFYNYFYLVCNFATANIPARAVYESTNISASGCSPNYGNSNDYTNLCFFKEHYDNDKL